MRRAALLAAVLVLASSAGGVAPVVEDESGDPLGWERGYWWDDPVDVTPGDGLDAAEREAVVARAMARLERMRGLEFREPVNVTVVTRAEYEANYSTTRSRTRSAWNNQVWKGLFLVGADRDVGDVFNDTLRASVLGYYEPATGDLVLVTDDGEPAFPRQTLVHELVHALQDQHFGLSDRPETQDRQLARNAVVEGEAERLANRYERRCGEAWSCVASSGGGGTSSPSGRYTSNVFAVLYHPYAVGPDFVGRVAERGGTDALDRLYADLPASTEQVIHAGAFPAEAPANVTVPDRSGGDWRRFDQEPVADTVGEASIYAMAVVHDVGGVGGGRYSYRHPVSAGWGGDALVPYRDGDRFGYVWETAWDAPADAREFHDAYLALLDAHDGKRVDAGRYRLPADDPYGGAYRVTRDDETVRIVHGPTLDALAGIHAP